MLNIVIFGKPGAGKGTQAEFLKSKYNLIHISTGDLFREHVARGTDLGKQAKEYLDKKYQPTGYNIGVNSGEDSGQTIFHLHIQALLAT